MDDDDDATLSLLESNVTLFHLRRLMYPYRGPRAWSSSSTKDSPRIPSIRDLPHHCLLPQNHPPLPLRLVATPLNLCWYFLARVSRQSAWSHVRVLEKLQHAWCLFACSRSSFHFLFVNSIPTREFLTERNSISKSIRVCDDKSDSEKGGIDFEEVDCWKSWTKEYVNPFQCQGEFERITERV